MIKTNNFKLDEIDPEDFEDTLIKIEKSFGAKFAENSFSKAENFGDICDITETQINLTDKDDCTTQQAFYKIRKAISLTQNITEKQIEPKTKLEDIFPRKQRRQNVKNFQEKLGINIDFLSMKNWLFMTILIGFILSLIAFFFKWQIAVSGLTFFILFTWTISKFSKELTLSTVGELTEKFTRENYTLARRENGTINRKELFKTIQNIFIFDHDIAKEHLTRDAKLGWK